MKKLFTLSIIAIAITTSCERNYTCECKNSSGTVVLTDVYKKPNKMAAKQACTYDASHAGLSCGLK